MTEELPIEFNITKTNEDSNDFGDKFKELLLKEVEDYDPTLASLVAGEKFAESLKNVQILKSAINKLIELPDFPEQKKIMIKILMMQINNDDPLIDRYQYHTEAETEKKDLHAVEHNKKFDIWVGNIKNLIEELSGVLPDSMVHELWARNSMFLEPLRWADETAS